VIIEGKPRPDPPPDTQIRITTAPASERLDDRFRRSWAARAAIAVERLMGAYCSRLPAAVTASAAALPHRAPSDSDLSVVECSGHANAEAVGLRGRGDWV
jgi:hypothetical protein